MLAQHMGKDRSKKQMCLILLIEIWSDQIVTSLHWFSRTKMFCLMTLLTCLEWENVQGTNKKAKDRLYLGQIPFNSSQPSVCTSFFLPPSERSKQICSRESTPSLAFVCSWSAERSLLQDRSYIVECFSKNSTILKKIRCTLRKGGRKVGGKEGWVSLVWGLGFFVWLCYFPPFPFLCCYKWQLNTFCPHVKKCAYPGSYRGVK